MKLLKFSATFCQPCKTLDATLKRILPDYPDITLEEIDISDDADLARQHGVRSVPTLILGDKMLVGNAPEARLRVFLGGDRG
jgi:thioredoxin 1